MENVLIKLASIYSGLSNKATSRKEKNVAKFEKYC